MIHVSAEQVVPSLHSMQQEPAWPAIVADHQPEDWPDSAPPPYCHQDLVYLSSEQALPLHNMLRCPERWLLLL